MTVRLIAPLILLRSFSVGTSLTVRNVSRGVQNHEPKFDLSHLSWVANNTALNSTVIDTADATSDGAFCGCSRDSCFIDSTRLQKNFHNQLILILGCSLDINAIGYFCNAATGVPMEAVVHSSPFGYLTHCDVGQFTIAYAFHPGASPPPYSSDYNQALLGTTTDIVTRTRSDVMAKFGREPVAIIVDASLWDVGNWWSKSGMPPYPYPIADAFLTQWCTKDLPALLAHVHTVYPNTHIAFRTAPTVFANPNAYGLSGLAVEKMVQCVELSKDSRGQLFGMFGVIDYHHVVDNVLQMSGAGASVWYKDPLHPGAQLSLMYMNNVLSWVNNFVMDLNS